MMMTTAGQKQGRAQMILACLVAQHLQAAGPRLAEVLQQAKIRPSIATNPTLGKPGCGVLFLSCARNLTGSKSSRAHTVSGRLARHRLLAAALERPIDFDEESNDSFLLARGRTLQCSIDVRSQ